MSADLTYAAVIEVRQGCDGCWWMRCDTTHHQWAPTKFAWLAGGAVPVCTFEDVRAFLMREIGPPYRVERVADEPMMA